MGGKGAEGGTGDSTVHAAFAVSKQRGTARVVAVAVAKVPRGFLGVERRLTLDLDPPTGQACGKLRVHPLLADGKRQLIVGDDDRRLTSLVVHQHLAHTCWREGLGHVASWLIVVGNNVDFLATKLADDHPNARPTRTDARTDRIDSRRVRNDGNLRAPACLTGHIANLNESVGNLGNFQLEQSTNDFVGAAADDDLRTLCRRADLNNHCLNACTVVVALPMNLLALGQEGLNPAKVDQGVARVGLLNDPGNKITDAVDVLLVHHLPLGLADPLKDDLLGGLRGDTPEVVRRHVNKLQLVLVVGRPIDKRRQWLDIGRVNPFRNLLLGLGKRAEFLVLFEIQAKDAHLSGVAVQRNPGELGAVRRLAIGGQERFFQGNDQGLGIDSLLTLDLLDGLDDLAVHALSSGRSLAFRM